MTLPVTKTKVVLPRLRPDILSRRRLLDLFEDILDSKLIILSAPAGYGKTSFLIDFAHKTEYPVCWYSLDALDRDAYLFISHLIASISHQFPGFGGHPKTMLENLNRADLDLDWLATMLVNEIYDRIDEHFMLILDDFHLIDDNQEVTHFLNKFLRDVGENCHVVISTRTLLTLPDLPLMVARLQVSGFSYEELAFNTQEIQALALQNYNTNLSLRAAQELQKKTEGWITGLLLSAHELPYGSQDRMRIARVSGVNINNFLQQQVLERQPPHIQEFLLRTSLLGEFNDTLCQQIFGLQQDWSALIRDVTHDNLFVLSVGEHGEWIRYHHIFQDFLQERLRQERPEERANLLRRMVDVYAGRGELEKAYQHAHALGEETVIITLIEDCGSTLIKGGRLVTLANWIDALPKETQSSHPILLSLRGVVYVMQGQLSLGLKLLDQADDDLRRSGSLDNLAVNLARRAHTHRFQGAYQEALIDAHEALDLAGNGSRLSSIRADALRAIGASKYSLGQVDEAIDYWSQSLNIYQWLEDRQNLAMVLTELGLALMSVGRYQESLENYQRSLEYWQEANNLVREANVLNNLGVLYHAMGEYDRALSAFENALEAAKTIDYLRMESYILCSIGDLYRDLEADQSALEAYNQARQIASKIDYQSLVVYADLAEAEVYRRNDQLDLSQQLLDRLKDPILQTGSDYERAIWHLGLGKLNLKLNKPNQAMENLKAAVTFFEQGGQLTQAAPTYLELSRAYFQLQDLESAQADLEKALAICQDLGSFQPLLVCAREAGLLLEWASEGPLAPIARGLRDQVDQFKAQLPINRRKLRPHTSSIPFAPPRLAIKSFGNSAVFLDGEPVSTPQWQNQRIVREMFYLLLAHPQGITREEIGVIFWPEVSTSRLKVRFKNAIYRMRRALGQEVVVYEGDRYWFNHGLDYRYDVELFLSNYEKARSAAEKQAQISHYQKALEQYQGDYLTEVEGNWAAPDREKYRRMYIENLTVLAKLNLESQHPDQALQYAQRLISNDAYSEPGYRLAMKAHAAMGNRAEVIRQFEACSRSLEEAELSPSQETIDIFELLRE